MRPITLVTAGLAATLVLAVVVACGHAQHMSSGKMPMPTITFPKDAAVVELPFREVRNHVVVPVTLGGKSTLDCTLDTGARGTVMFGDSLPRALGMTPMGEARIGGAGGGGTQVKGSLYADASFAFGALQLSHAMLVTMPDSVMRTSPLHGSMAMGRGLLEQTVVELDWDAHTVRFHDPARWTWDGSGVAVPLEFDDAGAPYVHAKVALAGGEPFDVVLVLDTGASHPLQLQPGSDARIVMPAGAKRQKIGLGATGQVWGAIGRAASFELGGVTFRDLPITFPDSSLGLPGRHTRNGNLGSGLLRRFRVILDYPHQRMILVPGPHVHDPLVLPDYEHL